MCTRVNYMSKCISTYPLPIVDCWPLYYRAPLVDQQSSPDVVAAMCLIWLLSAAQTHFLAIHLTSPSEYHRLIYSRVSVAKARVIQSRSLCDNKCWRASSLWLSLKITREIYAQHFINKISERSVKILTLISIKRFWRKIITHFELEFIFTMNFRFFWNVTHYKSIFIFIHAPYYTHTHDRRVFFFLIYYLVIMVPRNSHLIIHMREV